MLGYEALSRDPEGRIDILELFRWYRRVGQLKELKSLCFRLQIEKAAQLRLGRVFINVDFDLLEPLEVIPLGGGTEVILEISEMEAMTDVDRCLRITRQWREGGYQFAIDDFGAGFISLPFLTRLVPDFIKMDRTTIIQATDNAQFRAFLEDVLKALHNYTGQGIIAEGIETEGELQTVKQLHAHWAQGFLLGRPCEMVGNGA